MSRILPLLLLVACGLGIGGALYVNQQKAHTIPNYQVRAAEWIRQNLPSDRLIVSNEQPYVLTTHGESQIASIDGTSLCNLDLADGRFIRELGQRLFPDNDRERQQISEVYLHRMHELIAHDLNITLVDLANTSEHFITLLNINAKERGNLADLKKRIYIYHAQPDSQNVLHDRPYVQAYAEAVCLEPVFDKYPHLFTKIYDDQGLVRIWRFTSVN